MCRTEWGAFTWRAPSKRTMAQRRQSTASGAHAGTVCSACHAAPITGPRYSCMSCWKLDLCQKCFASGCHPEHDFVVCQRPSSSCLPASRDLFQVACNRACVHGQAPRAENCAIDRRDRRAPVRTKARPSSMAGACNRPEVRETSSSGARGGAHRGGELVGVFGEQQVAFCTAALEHVPARRASKSTKLHWRQRGSRGQFGGYRGDLVAGATKKMQGLSVCQSGGMAEALSFSVVGHSRVSVTAGTVAGELPSIKKG